MGSVHFLRAPATRRSQRLGAVHVMPAECGGWAVSHESASGDSWGGWKHFDHAEDAVAAAYRSARDEYGGCDVEICDDAAAALPVTPNPPEGW